VFRCRKTLRSKKLGLKLGGFDAGGRGDTGARTLFGENGSFHPTTPGAHGVFPQKALIESIHVIKTQSGSKALSILSRYTRTNGSRSVEHYLGRVVVQKVWPPDSRYSSRKEPDRRFRGRQA